MAEATAPAPPVGPRVREWVLRPYEATSLAPVWVGLVYTVLYTLFWLLWHNATGHLRGVTLSEPPPWMADPSVVGRVLWQAPGWWVVVLNALLVALLPTVRAYLCRGARRDLAALRPVLRLSDEDFERVAADTVAPSPRSLRAAGLVGAAWGLAIPILDPGIGAFHGAESLRDPAFHFVLLHHLVTGWLGARLVWAEVAMTRAYARLGARHTDVDLLDTEPLRPFARKGLRSALLWVVLSSVFSLFWLAPSPGRINVLFLLLVIALVTAAFLLPLRGVRERIREAKAAERRRANEAIRREREALLAPAGPPAGDRLASLLAWRDFVDGVREWPLDAPTVVRFALFVLLGVGSWLGGAVVERLLDATF